MTDDNITSNPSKKRKANDGRATLAVGGGLLSSLFGYYFSGSRHDTSTDQHGNDTTNDQFMQQSLSHMERMEQSMLRMEEKLSALSSVERRCELLEAKCNSLENKLEAQCNSLETKLDATSQSLKNHVDEKLHAKVNMLQNNVESALELLKQNKSFEYPIAIDSLYDESDVLYNEDEADFLVKTATALKEKTIKMRAEEFPDIDEAKCKAIHLIANEKDEDYCSDKLLPHWVAFAAALKQFTAARKCYSSFSFGRFQLNKPTLNLITEALIGKPFGRMTFIHNIEAGDYEEGGLSVDDILEVVKDNKCLNALEIQCNQIHFYHVDDLCSVVQNLSLMHLDLTYSFRSGAGDTFLTTLLANSDLKLGSLIMSLNHITSDVCSVVADFLASNTEMTYLDLRGNDLNDNGIALIATALRSNTTLDCLELVNNNMITEDGAVQAFEPLLYDNSSLNAAADSNHTCRVTFFLGNLRAFHFNLNRQSEQDMNRGRKIYYLLSSRNRTVSNTQYFDDIDVTILPYMLESIQRYGMIVEESKDDSGVDVEEYYHDITVGSLSIVYEVMRKWEKALCLYE